MNKSGNEKHEKNRSYFQSEQCRMHLNRLWSMMLFLGFLLYGIPLFAQVNSSNASRIEFDLNGKQKGVFKQTGSKSWNKMDPSNDQVVKLKEMLRDEHSIYLYDFKDSVTYELNISSGEIKKGPQSNQKLIGQLTKKENIAVAPTNEKSGFGEGGNDTVYVDIPNIAPPDLAKVMDYIKTQTTRVKLPYCYRQSYGRGVGVVRSVCSSGFEKDAALCYPLCKTGYGGEGPVCWQSCPSGFRNDGAFCAKPAAYGRGAGRVPDVSCPGGSVRGVGAAAWCDNGPTWPWDLKTWAAKITCHTNEEMNGGLCYPKCNSGFYASGCCVCSPNCPPGFGTDIGVSCTKLSYGRGAGDVLQCPPGNIPDETGGPAGLCYPSCKSGFHGVGPVCWQTCGPGLVECGAGCALTATDCGTTTFDQIFSVATLAANIATLGMSSSAPTALKAGEEAVKVGSKTVVVSAGKSGTIAKYGLKAIDLFQTVSIAGKPNLTLVNRIVEARTGTAISKASTIFAVSSTLHKSVSDYNSAVADDFINQTSEGINKDIDSHFTPATARYIKESWGNIQLNEMAKVNGFVIAQDVLSAVSIVDISGVTGVVSAYTKPICGEMLSFPTLSKSYK